MREIIKSMTRYTLATSLFGVKRLAIVLTLGEAVWKPHPLWIHWKV
jgi:hypothetical protein